MLTLPASLEYSRNTDVEQNVLNAMRAWLEAEERTPGVHASDLLDPLLSYWRKIHPLPLTDRLVGMFVVGKVLHVLLINGLGGAKSVDWKSDQGSKKSKKLKISYSVDYKIGGVPTEIKTTRSFYPPSSNKDLDLYAEQNLIYMAAENQTEGKLLIYYLNLKDASNQTCPTLYCFDMKISQADLDAYKTQIKQTSALLSQAIETKDPSKLPLCRSWKCGNRCEYYTDMCKPEGRFTIDPIGKNSKKWLA